MGIVTSATAANAAAIEVLFTSTRKSGLLVLHYDVERDKALSKTCRLVSFCARVDQIDADADMDLDFYEGSADLRVYAVYVDCLVSKDDAGLWVLCHSRIQSTLNADTDRFYEVDRASLASQATEVPKPATEWWM